MLLEGPEVVVVDEAHQLKEEESMLCAALSGVKTRRRLALTGSPLQNNLMEYYSMITFVRPFLLGTPAEFKSEFVSVIEQGQSQASPLCVIGGDQSLQGCRHLRG